MDPSSESIVKKEEQDEAMVLFESAMHIMDTDNHEDVGIGPLYYKRSASQEPEEYTFAPLSPVRLTDFPRPDHLLGKRAVAWRISDGMPVSISKTSPLSLSNMYGRSIAEIALDPFGVNPDAKFTRFDENGTPIVTLEEIHSISPPGSGDGLKVHLPPFPWDLRSPGTSDDSDGEEELASPLFVGPSPKKNGTFRLIGGDLADAVLQDTILDPERYGQEEDVHRVERQLSRMMHVQKNDEVREQEMDNQRKEVSPVTPDIAVESCLSVRDSSLLEIPALVPDASPTSFDSSGPPSPQDGSMPGHDTPEQVAKDIEVISSFSSGISQPTSHASESDSISVVQAQSPTDDEPQQIPFEFSFPQNIIVAPKEASQQLRIEHPVANAHLPTGASDPREPNQQSLRTVDLYQSPDQPLIFIFPSSTNIGSAIPSTFTAATPSPPDFSSTHANSRPKGRSSAHRSRRGPPSQPTDIGYELPNGPPWICPYPWCRRQLSGKYELTRHINTAARHVPLTRREGFTCRKCGEELSRPDARKRHEERNACGTRMIVRKPVGPPSENPDGPERTKRSGG